MAGKAFQEVANCVSFCDPGITGQFIEIRATLSRDASVNESPILYDLTVQCCNQPPEAVCRDIEVCTDPDQCTATVEASQVDGGSSDPDGDPITLSLSPPGPYPLGQTVVVLTVTDDQGARDSCEATITVKDCEHPTVECVPTVNPAGGNVPNAGEAQGSSPSSGQNPDGFYELQAWDNCDGANLSIWVKDSAEGVCGGAFAAGPYAPGTKVKLTQSPGKQVVKPMAGVIVAHINTQGEPVLVVTDAAGNRTCHNCLVPPPPK